MYILGCNARGYILCIAKDKEKTGVDDTEILDYRGGRGGTVTQRLELRINENIDRERERERK